MSVEPPEIVETDNPKVWCDGGGVLGHPRVYYDLSAHGAVDCGYCDRRFVWLGYKGADGRSGSSE